MYRRRLLPVILCLLLLLAALPVLGQEQLRGFDGSYQYVAFGNYPHTKEGETQPIVWRVLQVQDGVAYLLSDQIIDLALDWTNLNLWLNFYISIL